MVGQLSLGRILLASAALAMTITLRIDAQSQQAASTPTAPLAFEVASVRPVARPVPSGSGPWIVTRGRFRAEIGVVRGVIGWAYNILIVTQVKGGPDWIDREPYYFDARAENPGAGPDQIRPMLQTLLAEQFKLAVHRDTQEGQVYTLVVGKNGSKLEDAKDGGKYYINWTGPEDVIFTETPNLLGLVNILSSLLGAPVVDETGIKGSHNYRLEFTDPRDPRPRQTDSPDLFTAAQEQLGPAAGGQEALRGPRDRSHRKTVRELTAQMISFAYGNVKLHNPAITKEDVERIYDELGPRLGNERPTIDSARGAEK
jgi:uncharacterized protein (TIGR03435 family)